ncbi:hypothetical protein PVAND_010401 [Polypedilum vanderplanki]|uniref:Uncharacterized protein n=1 Tax=Polypedilum vanderplanki TaxID=319348 RepID=A0A9J6CG49_POLVA|nr:hypothetical protein PVAND_010401 [Polypedilum vanderplanki]
MSSYVPFDVRCRFCILTFCCKDCREKHEKKDHQNELDQRRKEEYLQSICHMCHGLSLLYNPNEKLSEDLLDHIVQNHFPLKCDKCLKVFETVSDIEKIGKCCKQPPPELVHEQKEEIIQRIPRKRPPELKIDNYDDDVLTPLTKINLHWHRKSKEFSLLKSIEETEMKQQTTAVIRSTSTPVLLHNSGSDATSSLQFSSIRYSSSSCENDLSPPSNNQQQAPTIPTPKSIKKNMSQNKKLHVQNTPLRQIMTKSIQKAIATHGHYQNMNLQQRKMSFDSSSSSNERTVSLMKLNESNDLQPLDLRTSPALKRRQSHESEIIHKKIEVQTMDKKLIDDSKSNTNVEIKIEEIQEIQVIYQTEKSSLVTNYRSCYSESTTPKIIGNNLLKKTISFESPKTHEKTPSFLIPMRTSKRSYSHDDDRNHNRSIDDTVFYTPKSTPSRSIIERRLSTPEISSQKATITTKKAPALNLWKYMTSVVGNLVTGGSGAAKEKDLEETTNSLTPPSENESKWTTVLQKPLKAAAEYFVRSSSSTLDDEDDDYLRAQKRRHSDDTKPGPSSSIAASAVSPIPSFKRRRIQENNAEELSEMLSLYLDLE